MNVLHKKKILICLCLLIAVPISGCHQEQNSIIDDKSPNSTQTATFKSVMASTEDKNWMYLTSEQYLEDFDSLYKQLKENYPYFGVAKRKANVDIHEKYNQTRKQISECNNDYDYFTLVQNFCAQIAVGHLDCWGRRYTYEVESYMDFIEQNPEYSEQFTRYLEILDNPTSKENYKKMEQFFANIEEKVDALNGEMVDDGEVDDVESETAFDIVITEIIEPNKIAYTEIKMFDMDVFDESQKVLFNFYKEVANYEHLIIDISNNGGGGMAYFDDLICAPNIDEPLTVPTYALIKNGDNNNRHLNLKKEIQEGLWQPISEFPQLEKMNADDLSAMDYFQKDCITIQPTANEKAFKGKIWLLVSGNVYSSSEYAAMFSKHSGFATLVGTNTGGDGIGTDPVHIILPNSGIVVQHSPIYGVTADGASSEEFGTTPDIISVDEETPLETCLKAINK